MGATIMNAVKISALLVLCICITLFINKPVPNKTTVSNNIYLKNKKYMSKYQLLNGNSVRYKVIDSKEYQFLLQNAIKEVEIPYFRKSKIHLMKNNACIVKSTNNEYAYIPSFIELEQLAIDRESCTGGRHILLNKNPYGKSFPREVDFLINQLKISLGIDYEELNVQLLLLVEQKILQKEENVEFMEDYMLNITALIGELLIKKYNAEWKMTKDISCNVVTWSPYLEINKKHFDFIGYLYEDIGHHNVTTPLTETYESSIAVIEANILNKKKWYGF